MREKFDILIIGAGASGLAAAINAKRTAPRLGVAMLERLPASARRYWPRETAGAILLI